MLMNVHDDFFDPVMNLGVHRSGELEYDGTLSNQTGSGATRKKSLQNPLPHLHLDLKLKQ